MKYPRRRSLQNRDTVSLPVSRHHLRRIRLPKVPISRSGRLGHRAVAPTMKLTVTGGTLTSTETTYNQAVYSYSYGNDMKNVLINVTGGSFPEDPSAYIPTGYGAVGTGGRWNVIAAE